MTLRGCRPHGRSLGEGSGALSASARAVLNSALTIGFKNTTACGTSVMFLPKLRLGFWSKHPVVEELQRLAGLVPDSAA
jgi:hypothetical protein